MKTCKQCGRQLEEGMFRSYVPRGKGVYRTSVGTNTVCKDCESLNAKVSRYVKGEETPEIVEFLDKAAALYRELHSRGLEPIGAYARMVLGQAQVSARRTDDDLIAAILGDGTETVTDEFMKHLRYRSFAGTCTEAWARYDELKPQLQEAGLREEAARLLDEWEVEEDD